ncbi:DNA recombination protein RmuC [Lishizhenia sp.]|uniref:DNA recombination protein RmuC n=1 Tax=Lishizhenia sp. TaxID=2497594 RepID=UPI00299D7AF0|nr:DNA recombination protein RmuC [Lishizhenia sp.]MDX1445397.1 DNA recombination protein RmuC [Lishizhenia sp.]
MEYITSIGIGVLLVLNLLLLLRSKQKGNEEALGKMHLELQENRKELFQEFRVNREELRANVEMLQNQLMQQLKLSADQQQQRLDRLEKVLQENAKEGRDTYHTQMKEFREVFVQQVSQMVQLQKEKFVEMSDKQEKLVVATEKQLENIRVTVDEKLHKTLENRLGESFKIVSDRLEKVQKGLGEMQSLAHGVGDLKRVLTNVKTRGVLGEIQLGNILEQILAPEQYEANVKTKKNSGAHVEFAIKLPGKKQGGDPVYLPIDAKFPQEDYLRLQQAYEVGDAVGIDTAAKALLNAIKKFAKDVSDKYLDPPNTTDFGVIFLPMEGLYAEVVKHPELIAVLQREYKIIIAGPTTLAAMLNSLQMGFQTLAIQKRSSEVWKVLEAVKKEFHTFGGVLEKAQKKLNAASDDLDTLVGTRTKMMLSKLKKIKELNLDEDQEPTQLL